MWPVSDQWDPAIRRPHEVQARADLWRAGAPTGVSLVITGGEVTVDERSPVRRTLSLPASDVGLLPDDMGDLLAPADADLLVWSGITYVGGDAEMVPVGMFRIESPARGSLLGGLTIGAADYVSVLQAARFVAPWNTPRGTYVTTEVARMVRDVLPWVDVVDLTGSRARTSAMSWEVDRWEAIATLLKGIGAVGYFNQVGAFVLDQPAIVGTPVWTVDANSPTAVLLDASLSIDLTGVYNAVTATSSATDQPIVSATVYQGSGPLRWRPGFKRPRYFSSPLLKTRSDCLAAARSILLRSVVVAQRIGPACAPNPALEEGDTVSICLPDREPVSRVITALSLPLGPGPMTMQVRTDADAWEAPEGVS